MTRSPAPDGQAIDELARQAQAGDRRALETLLRAVYDRVHGLCRRMTGNDADAADAAQEAMVAIVRGLPRWDGRAAFTTWAYRVATNACLDELRRRRRRPEPVDGAILQAGGDQGGHDAGRMADALADRMAIDAALATLPPEFRAAVVLRDLCDLDYAEIAETLGIPPGTVRSRIARARAALARHLGNPDDPSARPTG